MSFARSDAARWLAIGLRSLHLAATAWLGAALLGAPLAALPAGAVLLASGVVLLAADLAAGRIALAERAGAWVLAKLAAVAAMLAWPALAVPLFFALVVGSSVFAHAPRGFRHARLLRSGRAAPESPATGRDAG